MQEEAVRSPCEHYDRITDKPMRLTVTVCPADRNQFTLNIGQLPMSDPLYPADRQDLREQIVSGWPQTSQQDPGVWRTPDKSAGPTRREVVQVLLLALTIISTVAAVSGALSALGLLPQRRQAQPQAPGIVVNVINVSAVVERQPFGELSGRAFPPSDAAGLDLRPDPLQVDTRQGLLPRCANTGSGPAAVIP